MKVIYNEIHIGKGEWTAKDHDQLMKMLGWIELHPERYELIDVEYDEVKEVNKMTNYEVCEAIKKMIENSIITYETSRKMIIDALNKGKIDNNQYSDLVELSKKYL